MNEYMAEAVISAEDKRFMSHHGVDWIRTIGVIVKPSNFGQGGSTITQQLIKNLTDENSVTFVRKFNEILYALNIEKHYSKDEILEAYLNTIYLSHGCYGVNTAAETYFGKDVKDLNIAECATLAGITQAPTKYDPLLNPENNKEERQLWILAQMKENGYITEEEYQEAVDCELVFTNSENYKGSQVSEKSTSTSDDTTINSYYTDYVIDEVISDLQKMGYSAKKAKSMIYGGGLKIYSAIDFDVQDAIEDVYENYRRMPDETVEGACVVMDYHGRILGIICLCAST
jgi:penicillin-binding protein 1A